MRQLIVIVLLALLTTGLYSCSGEDDRLVSGPDDRLGFLRDYVHFDYMRHYLIRSNFRYYEQTSEEYVWWEASLGEPYTDMNGNGVYDIGTDIFIMSADPETNQDLNHNGRRDGPDDRWSPEFPFDDLDGDGIKSGEWPAEPREYYVPGLPFCDYNTNDIWDSLSAYDIYRAAVCSIKTISPSVEAVRFNYCNNYYSFTSDSGVVYRLPEYQSVQLSESRLSMELNDSGLTYQGSGSFHLLGFGASDTGLVDTALPITTSLCCNHQADKRISLRQTLRIENTYYSNLLKIRIDRVRGPQPDDHRLDSAFWEFYFDRHLGLIAHRFNTLGDSLDPEAEFFLETRSDSFPLPMSR